MRGYSFLERPPPDTALLRGMVDELRALHDRAGRARASTLRAALAIAIDVAQQEIARVEAAQPARRPAEGMRRLREG